MTDEECFIFGSHVATIYRTIPQRENWKIIIIFFDSDLKYKLIMLIR